jgi:8-oxo-dGTP pyrophosphatase MutT (NUDIX family)
LPKEAPVEVAVRELFEETCLTPTVDDLTFFSGNPFRVPLHAGQHLLVYVFSALVHVAYVNANLRTPTKVKHVVIAHSVVHLDGPYVVQTTVDIDVDSLAPSHIVLVTETKPKSELLHFGYVAQ